jgi:hypothetical protein
MSNPGRRRLRAFLILLLALLAVVVAGDTGLWWASTQRLRRTVADWQQAAPAQGWTLRSGDAEVAGWPIAARLILPDVAVTGGEAELPGGLAWTAGRVVLSIELAHPRQIALSAEGAQSLRLSVLPTVQYTAGRMVAVQQLTDATAPTALSVAGLRTAGGLTVATLAAEATLGDNPAVDLTLQAQGIGVPQAGGAATPIEQAALQVALSRLPPPGPDPAARAAAWRSAGGTLLVQRLAASWADFSLAATARLTLDAALQPQGTADVTLVNYAAALDALADSHVVNPRAAGVAKAVLGLMARPAAGGAGAVELPLSVQDRTVSVGQFPLARLPLLVWPGAQ